ncbi:MAG: MBG domain-containing protein, partial [Ilumatobacteraceae bacterium]
MTTDKMYSARRSRIATIIGVMTLLGSSSAATATGRAAAPADDLARTASATTLCPSAFTQSQPTASLFPVPVPNQIPTTKLVNCTGGAYVAPEGAYSSKHTVAKFGDTGLVDDGCTTVTAITVTLTGTPAAAGHINIPYNAKTNARLPLADTTYGTVYGTFFQWSRKPGIAGYTADPLDYPVAVFVATPASGEFSQVIDIDPTAISLADLAAGHLHLASYVVGWGAAGSSAYDEITEITADITLDSSECGTEVHAEPANSEYGQPLVSVTYNTKNIADVDTIDPGDSIVNPVVCKAYADDSFTTELSAEALPGTYPIRCTGDATTQLGKRIDYFDSSYTVSKIPLTISAKATSKAYGTDLVLDPATDWEITAGALRDGDAISSVTLTGPAAAPAANAGTYTIVPSAAAGTGLSVYNISYVFAYLTVTKAPLTVTPDPVTVTQGDSAPASYTFSYDGWVNDENEATPPLGWVAPTCTSSYTTATRSTDPAPEITCTGGAATNYEFVFESGVVTVNAPRESTVAPQRQTLDVTVVGEGAVSSDPAGIDCPSTCVADFADDADVVLTAVPDSDATFQGWSGSCSGTGSCTVSMTEAHSVTATFAAASESPVTGEFEVRIDGGGSVRIGERICNASCTGSVSGDDLVTLTAEPRAGYLFAGWSGPCSGTGPCVVSLALAGDVTAS